MNSRSPIRARRLLRRQDRREKRSLSRRSSREINSAREVFVTIPTKLLALWKRADLPSNDVEEVRTELVRPPVCPSGRKQQTHPIPLKTHETSAPPRRRVIHLSSVMGKCGAFLPIATQHKLIVDQH